MNTKKTFSIKQRKSCSVSVQCNVLSCELQSVIRFLSNNAKRSDPIIVWIDLRGEKWPDTFIFHCINNSFESLA